MPPLSVQPLVFIGLVTHSQSRFQVSRTELGVAKCLEAELRQRGISVQTIICTENFCSFPISRSMAAKSKIAQKLAMARWRYYLVKRNVPIHASAIALLLGFFEAVKTLFKSSSKIAIRRLVNIELAHLWLMQQAIKSCASWAIIIEDDAVCDSIADLADGLLAVIRSPIEASYINLSLSFTPAQLNAEKHLGIDPNLSWNGNITRSVLRSNLPLTNTVCAVAYEINFLHILSQTLESMGTFPVLPIDWKLNMALVELQQKIEFRDQFKGCLFVEPGPLIQGSLHPTT